MADSGPRNEGKPNPDGTRKHVMFPPPPILSLCKVAKAPNALPPPHTPLINFPSGLVVPMKSMPNVPMVARMSSARILANYRAGTIPPEQVEHWAFVCPELLKLVGGPLADLRAALGHVGASLFDVGQAVHIAGDAGPLKAKEWLTALETHVAAFDDECRNAEMILIPPAGQTLDQYVLHLRTLGQRALTIARRLAAWRCGGKVYLYEDRSLEQIEADELPVRRAISEAYYHLKQSAERIAGRENEQNAAVSEKTNGVKTAAEIERLKRENAASLARAAHASPPNGPEPPNTFWWTGKPLELPPMQFRLLSFLWNSDRRKAEADDLIAAVWARNEVKGSTVKSTVSRLNAALVEAGFPVSVVTKAGFLSLETPAE